MVLVPALGKVGFVSFDGFGVSGFRISFHFLIASDGSFTLIFPFFCQFPCGFFIGFGKLHNSSEIAKLAYIGSRSDRAEAQSILRQADAAFHDTRHTTTENEALYGVLSRYATAADCYENVAFVNYSLELWSAHLGNTEGFLWVYYSCEAIDYDGNVVCGSWNVPALWKVEKDDTGAWAVVQIREHP